MQVVGYEASSSAVAKRLRDASCLSVVSFVALIVQYRYLEPSFIFIISYFSFKFTSAYNSTLFCRLRRNVKPCCHTHDRSWLCIVRERAWSLSRCRTTATVTGYCAWRLVVAYPHYTTRDISVTTCEMVAVVHRRPCWEHVAHWFWLLEGYGHSVWYRKTRMVWLPDGEKISKISLFVLTWSTNVTDTRTDRRTDRHRMTTSAALMHHIAQQKSRCSTNILLYLGKIKITVTVPPSI